MLPKWVQARIDEKRVQTEKGWVANGDVFFRTMKPGTKVIPFFRNS